MLETSHTHMTICRGWLGEEELKKTWNKIWKTGGTTISDALKLKLLQTKDLEALDQVTHLAFMSGTTHHENLTIGILAGKHPRYIYNMPTFEVCKEGCKIICGLGGWVQICIATNWERLRWTNNHHHANPCPKLPKIHIWHGPFEFWTKLDKTGI